MFACIGRHTRALVTSRLKLLGTVSHGMSTSTKSTKSAPLESYVYSWGVGTDGQLGHKTFKVVRAFSFSYIHGFSFLCVYLCISLILDFLDLVSER